MTCPVCGNTLTPITVAGMTVNACQGGCAGIWFERLQLNKVDESSQSAGEALLHIEKNPAVRIDPAKQPRLKCPTCGLIMMRHFFSVKKQVLVDECPKCGGTWLDAGELGTIRTEFATDDARKKASEEYFNEVFGNQLARIHSQDEGQAMRAQKLAGMFRFICPSFYMPGKQRWGAF